MVLSPVCAFFLVSIYISIHALALMIHTKYKFIFVFLKDIPSKPLTWIICIQYLLYLVYFKILSISSIFCNDFIAFSLSILKKKINASFIALTGWIKIRGEPICSYRMYICELRLLILQKKKRKNETHEKLKIRGEPGCSCRMHH